MLKKQNSVFISNFHFYNIPLVCLKTSEGFFAFEKVKFNRLHIIASLSASLVLRVVHDCCQIFLGGRLYIILNKVGAQYTTLFYTNIYIHVYIGFAKHPGILIFMSGVLYMCFIILYI